MKTLKIIPLLMMLTLQSCPSKYESGAKPDTTLYIRNLSSDSVSFKSTLRSDAEATDRYINDKDVELFYSNLNSFFALAPNETSVTSEISKKSISNRGLHLIFVNRDTLLQYTAQTWDRKAGVKYYYMTDYEDYKRINFTFEYP